VFILVGVSILAAFETPVLIAFALLILWSAWKMFRAVGQPDQTGEDYSNHGITRLAGRILPVSNSMDGHRFFTKKDGSLKATPMFLCLLTVEFADLMFAFDSVPAVIAVTRDPFLIYSSNILAILGLRSMYFILAAAKKYLVHLEKAVVAILVFIGVKIILETLHCWPFDSAFNLYVIFGLLFIGVVASLATKKSQKEV
jgi:tellurite resistance protein TerC